MSHTTGHEIEKIYWKISEVAEMIKVADSTIHFWMNRFNIRVKKESNGKLRFTKDNIDQLKEIHRLVKIEGYTIKGAVSKIDRRFDSEIETMTRVI
jgi:DNA-binding transcriptional MerR regulator